MGVDMSLVVRNNFNDRKNKAATLKQLQDTLLSLEMQFGKGYFSIFDDGDNSCPYIIDNRRLEELDIISIELFDGFWLIDTPWRYHQYFGISEGEFWLRKQMFRYVKLLGMSQAYVCSVYLTWNSSFWKESQTTFDYWFEECRKEEGQEIKILDVQDVRNHKELFYNKDSIYLDTFTDLM